MKKPIPLSFLDLASFKGKSLAILNAVNKIPFGTRLTYQELAEQTGTTAEEVLITCKQNPLPLLIPCHRVLSEQDYPGGKIFYEILSRFEGI